MPEMLIIRHSIATANEQGILMGSSLKVDSELSPKGIALARKRGEELKNSGFLPKSVFTSQLKRAKQTAQIILDQLGVNIQTVELSALNERDFGQYDGKPYRYVLEAFEASSDPPTVEPTNSFVKRVLQGLEQLKSQAVGDVLVVSHSNPVMVMQAAVQYPERLDRYWEAGDPSNCQGFSFNYSPKDDYVA